MVLEIETLNIIIKYFGGKRNIVADALSKFKTEPLSVKDIEKCED